MTKPISTSDDILATLTRYGRPLLHCHDDMTWSAGLTCNTTAEGAKFEMKSGFTHGTPLDALSELLRRTEAAFESLSTTAAGAKPAPARPAEIEHKRPSLLERIRG